MICLLVGTVADTDCALHKYWLALRIKGLEEQEGRSLKNKVRSGKDSLRNGRLLAETQKRANKECKMAHQQPLSLSKR